jgi:hypothetical protein
MTIPYTNATLTAITGPGVAPDYDDPGSPGTARWTGSLPVYVAEELHEVESAGRVDEIIKTRVEIPYQIGQLVKRGDNIAYTYESASHTRIAEDLLRAPLVGRVRVLVQDA